MTSPVTYLNQHKPFTNPKIFVQPYDGLPDYGTQALTTAVTASHGSGFPLWVHTNGNQAQSNVVGVLGANQNGKQRDVIVHFTMPSVEQVSTAAKKGLGATFLVNDFYYYYQPMCEQILGSVNTVNLRRSAQPEDRPFHGGRAVHDPQRQHRLSGVGKRATGVAGLAAG
jgi:predicted amidohydrolase YtcJ